MAVPTAVSCTWLKDNIAQVKVLDASWYLPVMNKDARAEFSARRIPGALFLDIDKVCDHTSEWPHMMPPAQLMASTCASLGITREDHVVVYDGKGVFSAPRAWFMFKAAGHGKVSILDGGFPKWESEKLPIDTEPKPVDATADTPSAYSCEINSAMVMDTAAIEANIASGARQMLDARPKARFLGAAPEPRPIESGHIEGSFCVPWTDVLTPELTFKSEAELKATLIAAKVDLSKPVGITCGSGISACVVGAALHILGMTDTPLYDGAYTEWKTSGKPTFKDVEKSPYA